MQIHQIVLGMNVMDFRGTWVKYQIWINPCPKLVSCELLKIAYSLGLWVRQRKAFHQHSVDIEVNSAAAKQEPGFMSYGKKIPGNKMR